MSNGNARMDFSPDDLAGITDLFDGLTESELKRALEDLAARTGREFDATQCATLIQNAIADYYLVSVPTDSGDVLVPGPVSLPSLPEHGDDLPHILDIEDRQIDQETIALAIEKRLRGDAARAINEEDERRANDILDICYETEAWGLIDTTEIRESLDLFVGP